MLEEHGVSLFVKREDLNHARISGNKWWKLKYNLEEAIHGGHDTLLTFGGAYSNHIFATAAAAMESGLKSIGIIRGERPRLLNRTLQFALDSGMDLRFVSREAYRKKLSKPILESLQEEFGKVYLIPEGGSNLLAVKGCAEFATSELCEANFDYLFLPVGTGATLSGLVCGLKGRKKIVGVSVLKSGEFLKEEIANMIFDYSQLQYNNWSLLTEYHHGGYAKTSPELLSLIEEMREFHGLPLDHVYTGKLVFALLSEIERGTFKKGDCILMLHTGGLQGALEPLREP